MKSTKQVLTGLIAAAMASALMVTTISGAALATDEVVVDPTPTATAGTVEDTTVTAPTRGDSINFSKAFTSRSSSSVAAARALAADAFPAKKFPRFFKTKTYATWYAARHIQAKYGWGKAQMKCLTKLWQRESSWRIVAKGSGGKYLGIPQLSRSAVVAANIPVALFRSSPEIQIHLGAKYIKLRKGYGSPCAALKHSLRKGWY
ncbi:MAG: hypothetical protein RIS75_1376 [Actinomycetota bacterium]|jgi:hypothetical protein